MSASSQFYAHVGEIGEMASSFQRNLCGDKAGAYCVQMVAEMVKARYIDVDYDTISRAVVVTAGWPHADESEKSWNDEIRPPSQDATVEIGVLSSEGNADPEDIQFGGFLTVLGQDDHPKPTRFQTPTRHYPLLAPSKNPTATPILHPLTYSTSFNQPTGLHPTLTLTFPAQNLTAPASGCKLHTHLTLPSYLFIDKYQFNDALFLQSKNLRRLRSLSGATDLEAPDWAVSQWGSAALFELSAPKPEKIEYPEIDLGEGEDAWEGLPTHTIRAGAWNVSIPLHLRYLPAAAESHTTLPVPWPVVFWACRAESGAQHPSNPFDRLHLGYEGLFGPKTRFMTVQPAMEEGRELVEWISVPVLDTRQAGWVEAGTVGVVLAAFLGLCWVLFSGRGKKVRDDDKKKKQ
ncbi:pig-x-domain-containing protein [Stemphylium lycopersici]|uniref:Protein PBN1 n=1 Tax=Stemphylium lycopersici TaxID=183478 RepID=A0A364N3F4_STELY|nr:pig-x-domain-containing protein [Stemphylium lycopersici]RAR11047.1 pig-x-domain-containing protein [Stemphylium lycopersici]